MKNFGYFLAATVIVTVAAVMLFLLPIALTVIGTLVTIIIWVVIVRLLLEELAEPDKDD